MKDIYQQWTKNGALQAEENRQFIKELESLNDEVIDELALEAHKAAFQKVDCLQCGNCCKVLKPYFEQEDIERIAKHFDMEVAEFEMKYLEVNNYKQFRMATKPCSFLNDDNTCQIYDIRPTNCRQYPHTKRPDFHNRKDMIADHTEVCPAVFTFFKIMKSRSPKVPKS